jgi:hypothetical protein
MKHRKMPEDIGNVPIGYSCFEQTLSVSLDYYDAIYEAAEFSIPLFIYEKNSFLGYEFEKNPSDYLFAQDPIYFDNPNLPRIQYRCDFQAFIYGLYKRSMSDRIVEVDMSSTFDAEQCFEKRLCISIPIDPYYFVFDLLSPETRKRKRHMYHYVNLLGKDSEKNTYRVVDANFRLNADIPITDVMIAHSATGGGGAFILLPPPTRGLQTIRQCVKEFLFWPKKSEVLVNGRTYSANTPALRAFTEDFASLAMDLEDIAGDNAPQYMSYPTVWFRHMCRGNVELCRHFGKMLGSEILKSVEEAMKRYYDAWNIFDAKLDMCFLKRHKISNELQQFEKCLERIRTTWDEAQTEALICLDELDKWGE